ncbi:cationic amino acid transporter 4 [Galendromus occidentalis]|uniref:Cationic amino acid transporter 4 n=1 Tax=Galendromus occidentalis TaxID=34638 RepID=A0AAJ6VUX9_9ACAR|nr:cationic amino acid transporter 4 [Galendromus occidentalis]
MMGSGIYVISPEVAKKAGPACVLSYMIAGIASMLAALAYAEFGVRFPRAGSAYSYVYFSMGEFLAFIVGWNVILENTLAISAVIQACGAYIDSLMNGAISKFIISNIGTLTTDVEHSYFNTEPRLLAIAIMLVFVVILLLGTSGTSSVGNVLCAINIGMLLMIVAIGIWKGDVRNWTNASTGGFFPKGWQGVFSAASMCFFSYGGFDAISAAGEEAKDPRRSMPIATIVAMMTVTVLYTAVAACLTLLRNWTQISQNDGFPDAMQHNEVYWAKYLVTIGAMCGMTTVSVVTLYTIVRAAYSMAEDGLLCPLFAVISKRTQVPQYSMLIFACVSTTIAVFFNIETIVDMLSIGTLMAYMMVTCGLVVYRYCGTGDVSLEFRRFPRLNRVRPPFIGQRAFVYLNLALIIALSFILSFAVQGLWNDPTYLSQITAGTLILVLTSLLSALEEVPDPCQTYRMPLMPWMAVVSIMVNCVLMSTLPGITWVRLIVWLLIGSIIYFTYGIRNSELERRYAACGKNPENNIAL